MIIWLLLKVFVQDKPVSVYNFSTSNLDDVTVKDDEINEVKAELLVKSLFPSLGAPNVSSIIEIAVSLSSSNASIAISRATTTCANQIALATLQKPYCTNCIALTA